jgi:hypothetical protein
LYGLNQIHSRQIPPNKSKKKYKRKENKNPRHGFVTGIPQQVEKQAPHIGQNKIQYEKEKRFA